MATGVWEQDEAGRTRVRIALPASLMAGAGNNAAQWLIAAWLGLLAFLQIFRNTFLVRQRDRDDYTSLDLYNMINVAAVLLALATFVMAPPIHRALKRLWDGPLRWYIVFYILAGLTFVYASSMVFAIYRSLEMVANILLAGLIMIFAGSRDAARRVLLWGALAGLVSNFTWHALTFGISPSGLKSNNYPVVALMGMIMCVGLIQGGVKTRLLYPKILLPLFVFFWIAGTSSASMISGLFGIGVMLMVSKRGRVNIPGIALLGIVAYISATFLAEPLLEFLFPGKSLERIGGLSGRWSMWMGYMQAIVERPIHGWGFPTGEKEYLRIALGGVSVMSTHNSVLSVLVNTGLIGFSAFMIAIVQTVVWCFKGASAENPEARVMMGAIAAVLLNSMSYPIIGSHWFWTSTYFFALVAYMGLYVAGPAEQEGAGKYRVLFRWAPATTQPPSTPSGA